MKIIKKIPGWALTVLLALFFIVAGTEKWREAFHIVTNYNTIGINLGFMKPVGTLEILCAVGLFIRKYSVTPHLVWQVYLPSHSSPQGSFKSGMRRLRLLFHLRFCSSLRDCRDKSIKTRRVPSTRQVL